MTLLVSLVSETNFLFCGVRSAFVQRVEQRTTVIWSELPKRNTLALVRQQHWKPLLVLLAVMGCLGSSKADTMLTIRWVISDSANPANVQNPMVHIDVYYRRGSMRRKDSFVPGATPALVHIADCATKTGFLIDLKANEYRSYRVVDFATRAQLNEYVQKNPSRAVPIESRTVDTGERKTVFGHSARHLVTRIKRAPDSNNNGGEETIDAWYIDHEHADDNCAPGFVATDLFHVLATQLATYPDVPQFNHTGPLPNGLAMSLRRTITIAGFAGKKDRIITFEETVEELSDSTLPTSLFQLPAGVHENSRLLGAQPAPVR